MSDTIPPTPSALSFSGTTGTLTWTEADSPPVQNSRESFTFSGAGTASANGIFIPVTGANAQYNSAKQFTNGSTFVNYTGNANGAWYVTAGVNQTVSVIYFCPNGSRTVFPASGWSNAAPTGSTGSGINPGPTVASANGNTIFGVNQGLTITGLSGGAVTISNVVTTGTTTTFTTSRAIAPSETGGSLNGAAGSFSDSATTQNYTAAFSFPVTFGPVAPTAPGTLTMTIT